MLKTDKSDSEVMFALPTLRSCEARNTNEMKLSLNHHTEDLPTPSKLLKGLHSYWTYFESPSNQPWRTSAWNYARNPYTNKRKTPITHSPCSSTSKRRIPSSMREPPLVRHQPRALTYSNKPLFTESNRTYNSSDNFNSSPWKTLSYAHSNLHYPNTIDQSSWELTNPKPPTFSPQPILTTPTALQPNSRPQKKAWRDSPVFGKNSVHILNDE